jgi:hypothetical protein
VKKRHQKVRPTRTDMMAGFLPLMRSLLPYSISIWIIASLVHGSTIDDDEDETDAPMEITWSTYFSLMIPASFDLVGKTVSTTPLHFKAQAHTFFDCNKQVPPYQVLVCYIVLSVFTK